MASGAVLPRPPMPRRARCAGLRPSTGTVGHRARHKEESRRLRGETAISAASSRLAFRLPATQNTSWPLAATTHAPPTTILDREGSTRIRLGCDMRQEQIHKGHQAACARRHRDTDEVLSLGFRDPDIARAKRIQAAPGSRITVTRSETAT
jgi:hypothetical protein